MTATGKRERAFYPTRDKAKEAAAALRERFLKHGAEAATIKPALADDAATASTILAPFSVSLTQAAKFYADHHDKRRKCPLLASLWDQGEELRKNHRPRTLADLRAWKKALPDWIMATNILDLDQSAIRRALDEATTGATRWKNGLRNLSAILGDAVKAELLVKNPCTGIAVARSVTEDADCEIYTVDELKTLFAACRDYAEGIDRRCAACAPAFALMAFGGLRPDEAAKIKWEDISLELRNVRISAAIAKKGLRRNVRINGTLAAWLETVPEDQRQGRVAPPRWRYKAARVRREAGICGREKQDALRHSFGTYTLATENDLAALKSDMGHAHMAVFFEHYHKAMTKRDALPYWQVLPEGAKLQQLQAV
jgi:integrase